MKTNEGKKRVMISRTENKALKLKSLHICIVYSQKEDSVFDMQTG